MKSLIARPTMARPFAKPFRRLMVGSGVARGAALANPITSGLLAEYWFDEGSGETLIDHSPNAYDGTLVGSPAWQVGGGLTCTGTQKVNIPAAVFAATKTAVFAAAKPSTGHRALVGSNEAPGLLLSNSSSRANTLVSSVGFRTLANEYTFGDQLISYVIDASQDSLYYSDAELTYQSRAGSLADARTNPSIGNGSGSTVPFGVPIYFALFYSEQLTASQITELESYVRARLVAQSGLPNKFVFDGNSLVEGSANPTPADRFYNKTLAILGGPESAMVALSGQHTSAIATSQAAYPHYSIRRPKNIYLLWEITNDLSSGSVTTEQARLNVITACNNQRNRGSLVVVMSCLPRPDAGNYTEANRQTVNAAIRADFPTNVGTRLYTGASYADILVDVGSHPTIGIEGANNDTQYYNGDKLHLAAGGNELAAIDAAAGINYLL